ncbi:DUF1330 domain-containing protein [Xanthomonas phaseoli pv. phaseoli]|uniref:DUF1330 domain-containing protein n=1 Tax=Xanthomonas campestris pv. phaseoli TaxID=317013 RepID=A0AB38E3Y3_XANCH|nr:DUF1330 domain-containing protein [Xanthomonas phaseoli]ATS23253.1 DUF1330 domain-containing protein [Xanthomonas phaseoli pv. phaseoli]ATS34408.1 DUF1330 domain-containing protein [Xanthomonas phaseoli pv. phaseoli]KHD60434.1 hypothetical protein PK63_20230 [Xanthomonas phaseoli pv. phaseoli]KHD60868.1 hypothetical protein PK68_18190 [Xanthomonas phaseoli pv. phaseoli]KHS22406.1 hypothetical protein RM66_17550 [Xanthomonas phaseoli pv. phaseoli]
MVAFSPDALAAFLDNEDTSAIVMLNLIRFQPDGGRQCYHQYLRLAEPILARFGAQIVFSGDGLPVLTAGQAHPWDAVTLVRYPDRSAFKQMIADAAYQQAFEVGRSAIAQIVLQPFHGITL